MSSPQNGNADSPRSIETAKETAEGILEDLEALEHVKVGDNDVLEIGVKNLSDRVRMEIPDRVSGYPTQIREVESAGDYPRAEARIELIPLDGATEDPDTGRLAVTVVDGDTHDPVRGAIVSAEFTDTDGETERNSKATDRQGKVFFTVPMTKIDVTANHSDYHASEGSIHPEDFE